MVMGPTAGVVLADIGADVIKVEPVGGDHTRTLLGSGAGYFPMFNRNKSSICTDLKSPDGLIAARRLIDGADVGIENFRSTERSVGQECVRMCRSRVWRDQTKNKH